MVCRQLGFPERGTRIFFFFFATSYNSCTFQGLGTAIIPAMVMGIKISQELLTLNALEANPVCPTVPTIAFRTMGGVAMGMQELHVVSSA